MTLLAAPVLAWLLSRILLSDYDELSIPKRLGAVAITIVIGILAFLLGKYNHLFLTCTDFDISGNDLPSGCARGGPRRLP
ncbi:hypothetical protein ACFXJ8_43910 [Nonomuraea sp. NPDC059194]|uniref:hypothetical protein n=1 Tax=Nonomuraea sp. NPDC059194 TaxID=3346764 RepID=UPI0036934BD9